MVFCQYGTKKTPEGDVHCRPSHRIAPTMSVTLWGGRCWRFLAAPLVRRLLALVVLERAVPRDGRPAAALARTDALLERRILEQIVVVDVRIRLDVRAHRDQPDDLDSARRQRVRVHRVDQRLGEEHRRTVSGHEDHQSVQQQRPGQRISLLTLVGRRPLV